MAHIEFEDPSKRTDDRKRKHQQQKKNEERKMCKNAFSIAWAMGSKVQTIEKDLLLIV